MKSIKNIAFLCLLSALLVLTGCRDDLDLTEKGNEEIIEMEGDALYFTIKLDKDLSSRSDSYDFTTGNDIEAYENYIDTQDKFRVFFFTEQGDFLFGANDRTVGSSTGGSNDHSSAYWYVRIPMNIIVDRDNQEYDIDKIKNYLKNNPFKIAVLANWPNGGEKVNPADWDDSENTGNTEDNPSSTLKGNPKWNWSNSILNKEARPQDIRNINDLHHVYKDSYYGADSRNTVYGEFMAHLTSTTDDAGYYMGEPTDWVKMRDVSEGWKSPNAMVDVNGNGGFTSREEANKWIRANCTPDVEINQKKEIYRHYQHMWFLWNFDASYKYGQWLESDEGQKADADAKKAKADELYGPNWGWNDGYTGLTNPWGVKWYGRNGKELYDWMHKSYNNGGTALAIGNKTIDIGENNNDVFFSYTQRDGNYAYCRRVTVNNKEYYGVQLPNIGDGKKNTYTGMIKFQARTSGTLRIKWGSYNGASSGLGVQVGDVYSNHPGVTSKEPVDWTTEGVKYWNINIDADSEPVYIFCTQGQAVVYSIEFIRGMYLYSTDREGVAPNKVQGIPMYGVKRFAAIGDWQKGTTFNLNDQGSISLIRALAKVEVYIKSDFGLPRHVYMKNMNRAARCEPIDVYTSTDLIWNEKHNEGSDNMDGLKCEWYRIMDYGPSYQLYDNGAKSTMSKQDYADWLSWFYGSWQYRQSEAYPHAISWKKDNNDESADSYEYDYSKGYFVHKGIHKGWQKSKFNYSAYTNDMEEGEKEPPHIFNPYMYRSSFCRFLYAGTKDGYHKYVLYVPEKNIDDPATPGVMNSDPKVPHIEYRFDPPIVQDDMSAVEDDPYSNTEYNLDDNDCYRIYFTNYGFSSKDMQDNMKYIPVNEELHGKEWNSSTYDNYEKDRERLTKHWPIMRNHKYQFFVGGSGPENPEIQVRVEDWGHRKVVVTW